MLYVEDREYLARVGEDRTVFRVVTSKPVVKRSVSRPRRSWEDNVSSEVHGLEVADK